MISNPIKWLNLFIPKGLPFFGNNWILFCDRDGNLSMNSSQDSLSLQRNPKWRNMPQRSHSIEDGVDMGQISVVRETFDTLLTKSLKVSAVVISLLHGPFSVKTAAKIVCNDQSEAIAQLEGLVAKMESFL